ncbi:CIC11C00000000461 [Sungouiella intermedia]|uniref:CIC11C00000000461 n=1 Tax=Sungouiella intermedia TaxID=45354 RepID=A0A1L0DU25_9ASCO|nr:CIC11C00000000461 [[Candida] intermedia]
MSNEDLNEKIKELYALVHKQSEVIAQTGKQLMEIQVKDVKSKMAQMDTKPQTIDTEDFVTNEDIVQLVGELQSQLDFLEDRTVKRAFNTHIDSSSAPTSRIAPLCNRFGEPAPAEFPETVEDLQKISPENLLHLAEYYELIVENEPNPELEEIINSDTFTKEDAEKLLGPAQLNQTTEEKLKLFSKDDLNELFDEFTRYIGVRIRRGSGW